MNAAEAALAPADVLRQRLLLAFGAPLRSLIVDRERRVALLATVSVLAALAGACLAPLWMLVLGPVVLGVPHLLADLRYLVVRPGLHRRAALWLAVGLPLIALAVSDSVWPGLAAAAGALLVSRGSASRKILGLLAILALVLGARSLGGLRTGVVASHLHNLVAVAFWWTWRPRKGRLHWIPLGLCAAGVAFLLWGPPLEPVLSGPLGGLGLERMARVLSGGAPAAWALRLALLYAFGQGVHYAVWLRLMPEEDRARGVPRSFRASLRALHRDMGPWILGASALAALAIALWAVADLAAARAGYFRLALFHGHLELAALALLWAEGRLDRA